MKLKQININLSEQINNGLLKSAHPESPYLYMLRPSIQMDHLYNSSTGHDSGSRAAGNISMTTGIPNNPRHRKFLGMQRLGTIRL